MQIKTNPPNVMEPGTWLIVALVALAILVPVVVIGVKLWRARTRWRDVRFEGTLVRVAGPESDQAVVRALGCALAALQQVWPTSRLIPTGLRILVMPTESWANIAGVQVGGEQDGDTLRIDRSLTSLCHELAHLFEQRIDSTRDDAHAGWTSKLLWKAIEDYNASLKAGA